MNILEHTTAKVNKHFAEKNFGTEEKPNITFKGDKFFCSYVENDKLILSNGIVNADKSIELKVFTFWKNLWR